MCCKGFLEVSIGCLFSFSHNLERNLKVHYVSKFEQHVKRSL
jgi:hypothetical protein